MQFVLLYDVYDLVNWGGFLIITLFVFAETGLLLGLLIPGGETLIFTAGLMASTGILNVPLIVLLLTLTAAGFAGDISGYYIGRRVGPDLYHKRDRWYFKKKYLMMAGNFLQKHRHKALIIGKFLPVIRPFSPVISGVTGIKSPVFLSISFLSCSLYFSIFILGGYFLGSHFPFLVDYLVWILPASILFSLLILIVQMKKEKKNNLPQ